MIDSQDPHVTVVHKLRDVNNCKGRVLSTSCTFSEINGEVSHQRQ